MSSFEMTVGALIVILAITLFLQYIDRRAKESSESFRRDVRGQDI